MKNFIYTLLLLLPLNVFASAEVKLQRVNVDLEDFATIQKGAEH